MYNFKYNKIYNKNNNLIYIYNVFYKISVTIINKVKLTNKIANNRKIQKINDIDSIFVR